GTRPHPRGDDVQQQRRAPHGRGQQERGERLRRLLQGAALAQPFRRVFDRLLLGRRARGLVLGGAFDLRSARPLRAAAFGFARRSFRLRATGRGAFRFLLRAREGLVAFFAFFVTFIVPWAAGRFAAGRSPGLAFTFGACFGTPFVFAGVA